MTGGVKRSKLGPGENRRWGKNKKEENKTQRQRRPFSKINQEPKKKKCVLRKEPLLGNNKEEGRAEYLGTSL